MLLLSVLSAGSSAPEEGESQEQLYRNQVRMGMVQTDMGMVQTDNLLDGQGMLLIPNNDVVEIV